MRELSFGMSPCPNDTFAFHALVHGLVPVAEIRVAAMLDDIEGLNRRAMRGELELTKLSIGALATLDPGAYVPLRAGAALGRGVGPLVVTRDPGMTLEDAISAGPVAIPGRATTAFLLLRLAAGDPLTDAVEMRYDEVLGSVARGDVAAGLIIHESRFTYGERGLHRAADLGEWWEQRTGMPLPLAVICARGDLDLEVREAAETALRASVAHAFAHPSASADWVRDHAQEMSPGVCRQHIELYVNEYTLDVGDTGTAAIETLLAAAR